MEWFSQKTSIAGIQISNWILVLIQSAGSPEPSREALHEGHRRVASIA